jgi:hypothetical protein
VMVACENTLQCDLNTLQAAGKEMPSVQLHLNICNWQFYAALADNDEIDLR